MLEFERENKELRKALKKQEQQQQQCGPAPSNTQRRPSQPSTPPTSRPSAPPTSRTEATRLPTAGERKRVARQPGANQREGGVRGGGRLGDVGPGTSGGAGGEGRGQRGVGDRGVANDIIQQRQEDEQSNVITEKYSRLRIKSVGQILIKRVCCT